jgi:hypothetical protein
MELGRPTNGSLQYRLPTHTANAHDVHNAVLDDLIEYSTNIHMTENSHERGEAPIFTPDALIAHMSNK